MTNKKIIAIFLVLIAFSLTISGIAAPNNAKYSSNGTMGWNMKTSDNKTLHALCLDYKQCGPYNGNLTYTLKNTSSIDNRIKEVIVKYARPDDPEWLAQFYANPTNQGSYVFTAIQHTIWYIQNDSVWVNRNLTANPKQAYSPLALEMIANLTGKMNIGDVYTFIEGNYKYTFTFYFGVPEGYPDWQELLMFDYNRTLIEVPNSPLNNTTTPPNTPDTPDTPDTPLTPHTPDSPNLPSINSVAKAGMEKTGLPVIAVLLVIALAGIGINRKR